MLLVACSLAVFSAVFLWDGAPGGAAISMPSTKLDTITAWFAKCGSDARYTCVVDGDTI